MNNIKELRKEKGLTQKALADLIGTDQTAVSKWEKGISIPTSLNLLAMSNVFEASMDYIMGKSKYFYPENQGKDMYITAEEREIIEEYRQLSPDLQKTLRDTLKTFAGK